MMIEVIQLEKKDFCEDQQYCFFNKLFLVLVLVENDFGDVCVILQEYFVIFFQFLWENNNDDVWLDL